MIKDYFKMAVSSLTHRRLRSWLTMIGIFIGIAAVIAIISLGQGLQSAINDQFSSLGSDKIIITPGSSALGGATSVKLTDSDRKVIDQTLGVYRSVGLSYKSAKLTFKDNVAYGLAMGYTIEDGGDLWDSMMGGYLYEGRLLQKGDNFKVYLGYDYTQDNKVFPHGLKLGDKININGYDFQVVGFQKSLGNSGDDQAIHMTDAAYQRVFGEKVQDDYAEIIVQTEPGVAPATVADTIKKDLRRERGLKEGDEDFTIQTAQQLIDSFNSILLIVQVVIVGIAAISLVVGGVGIMNTMYTAVLERTTDIGVMKAIGARNSDIMIIFLIESGLLGLLGGLIGVVAGLLIAKTVEIFGTLYIGTPYLKAWWSWGLILGALAFSFLVGAASGVTPAWQASKQKPVDSLRYE